MKEILKKKLEIYKRELDFLKKETQKINRGPKTGKGNFEWELET